MNRAIILFFGLLLAAILAYFCVRNHMQHIPTDVQSRTYDALQADNLTSVGIDVDGRDVTLSGIVHKDKTKDRAGIVARQVKGVRVVNNEIMVVPIKIPEPVVAAPAPVLTTVDINDQCEKDLGMAMEGKTIEFASGSSELSTANMPLLDEIARISTNCPDSELLIEGYTDNTGSSELNVTISQRRANSVANYLRNSAALTQTITAVGYGAEKPVADNSTIEGRAKNRRIEFKVKTLTPVN